MSEEIKIDVKPDEDSVFIMASKPNSVDITDIPCTDTQFLADLSDFLELFAQVPDGEEV